MVNLLQLTKLILCCCRIVDIISKASNVFPFPRCRAIRQLEGLHWFFNVFDNIIRA